MNTPRQIAAAFASVREQVRRAELKVGRVGEVELLPVTKGFGIEAWQAASNEGATSVGENYVQELVAKLDAWGELAPKVPAPRIEFIGQLQTNKVKFLAGRVARYCSVDRGSLVEMIARRDPGAEVLIQVNPAPVADDSSSKAGCSLEDLDGLVDYASGVGLVVVGLMAVGPTNGGPEAAQPVFAAVRSAADRLGLKVCSMGMSDDLDVAVAEGSTQVRIGTALFGQRKTLVG